MKATVQKVIIDRDLVLKVSKRPWLWEIPVIQEKYGDGGVQLLDEVEVEVEGLPDASEEYARLAMAHGGTGGNGSVNSTYVELAYGRGKAGVDALRKAIAAAGEAKVKKMSKKVAAKKPKSVEPDDGDGDPLAI
jgi:hypothetical protein